MVDASLFPLSSGNTASLGGLLLTTQIRDRPDPTVLKRVAELDDSVRSELDDLLAKLLDEINLNIEPGTEGAPGDLETLQALRGLVQQSIDLTNRLLNVDLPNLQALADLADAIGIPLVSALIHIFLFDPLRDALDAEVAAFVNAINSGDPNFNDPALMGSTLAFDALNDPNYGLAGLFTSNTRIKDFTTAFFALQPDVVSDVIGDELDLAKNKLQLALTNFEAELVNIDDRIAQLGGATVPSAGRFGDVDLDTIFEAVRRLFTRFAVDLTLIDTTGQKAFVNVLRISRPELFPYVENPQSDTPRGSITGNHLSDVQLQRRLRGLEALFDRSSQTQREMLIPSKRFELEGEIADGTQKILDLLNQLDADPEGIAQVASASNDVFATLRDTFVSTSSTLFETVLEPFIRDPEALAVILNRLARFFTPVSGATLVDREA